MSVSRQSQKPRPKKKKAIPQQSEMAII